MKIVKEVRQSGKVRVALVSSHSRSRALTNSARQKCFSARHKKSVKKEENVFCSFCRISNLVSRHFDEVQQNICQRRCLEHFLMSAIIKFFIMLLCKISKLWVSLKQSKSLSRVLIKLFRQRQVR